MKKILSAALSLLVLFSLVAVLRPPSVSAKPLTNYNVLILKNSDAWGSPTVETTLTNMSIPYDVMTSTELQNKTAQDLIGTYDMIIIVSDQRQQFYNEIDPQMGKLEEYVKAGKVLEIHAANWGWGGGVWTTPLPGGVGITKSYSNKDYIAGNGTMLYSTYSSHSYLINLPANAEVITVQAPTGTPDNTKPSTAIYSLGDGKVFVTGLTIEYSVARKGTEWATFYRSNVVSNLQYIRGSIPVYTTANILITYNLYHYHAYKNALKKYNKFHEEAIAAGIANETIIESENLNKTAAAHFANVTQYGPIFGNFPRFHIFDDMRWAYYYQNQAIHVLQEALDTQ